MSFNNFYNLNGIKFSQSFKTLIWLI